MEEDQKIGALLESVNIAEKLDDEELLEIGMDAKDGFELDLQSRETWDQACDQWMALAKQCVEQKSYPWENASNVKYPLLSTAAMQFAARASAFSPTPAPTAIMSPRQGREPEEPSSSPALAAWPMKFSGAARPGKARVPSLSPTFRLRAR